MKLPRKPQLIWWILLVAFLLRLGFAAAWSARLPENTRFFFADSESYWELGKAIAAGEPYAFRSSERMAFRTPGYPLLLAPLFLIGGLDVSPWWGQVLSVVFGTAAVAAIWWLARVVFDQRVANWAAGIAAFYPGAIATSGFVLTEAPFGAAMIVQLACWCKSDKAQCDSEATRKSAMGWAFAAGVFAGVAALIRPSWVLFTPFASILFSIFRGERSGRDVLRNQLVLIFGLCLTLAPWWIRNAMIFGRFVPTTLQVGPSLYDGLNPQADGSSNMRPVEERAEYYRDPAVFVDGLAWLKDDGYEYRLTQVLGYDAVKWAANNPARAAELAVIKFTRLWNVWPNEPSMRGWAVRLVVAGAYIPVLFFAVWGAWRFRGRGRAIWLCLLPAVYFTLLHIFFVSSIRYRQPAMLALFVLSAAAMATLFPTKPNTQVATQS